MAKVELATLVAATRSDAGFMFATKADVAALVKAGHAEQNEGMANPENAKEFATRATAEGITAADNAGGESAPAEKPADDKPTFQRFSVKATELPKAKRGGGGKTLYPFDDLKAPSDMPEGEVDGFFVPATDAKPKPWESLQSAVSAATRRYATQTGTKAYKKPDGTEGERATYDYTRKFKAVEFKAPDGTKGAFVQRLQ